MQQLFCLRAQVTKSHAGNGVKGMTGCLSSHARISLTGYAEETQVLPVGTNRPENDAFAPRKTGRFLYLQGRIP